MELVALHFYQVLAIDASNSQCAGKIVINCDIIQVVACKTSISEFMHIRIVHSL